MGGPLLSSTKAPGSLGKCCLAGIESWAEFRSHGGLVSGIFGRFGSGRMDPWNKSRPSPQGWLSTGPVKRSCGCSLIQAHGGSSETLPWAILEEWTTPLTGFGGLRCMRKNIFYCANDLMFRVSTRGKSCGMENTISLRLR